MPFIRIMNEPAGSVSGQYGGTGYIWPAVSGMFIVPSDFKANARAVVVWSTFGPSGPVLGTCDFKFEHRITHGDNSKAMDGIVDPFEFEVEALAQDVPSEDFYRRTFAVQLDGSFAPGDVIFWKMSTDFGRTNSDNLYLYFVMFEYDNEAPLS